MRTRLVAWLTMAAGAALLATPAHAQSENPAFVDDAPAARATLAGLSGLIAAGNESEAVRALQRLLDEAGDRLIESPEDPGLYRPVRDVVHDRLLERPDLLARYRAAEGPAAERMLERGELERLAATRLLTPAGHEAVLRLAQLRLEAGAFDAARLALLDLESHPDRTGAAGRDAARLATAVARYLDRDDARALAARWNAPDAAPAPIEPPPWTRPQVAGAREGGQALDAPGLVPTPLQRVELSPPDPTEAEFRRLRPAGEEDARPWTLPTVVGDVVYTNDGRSIAARDRYTLAPRWRVEPAPDPALGPEVGGVVRAHHRNRLEDSTTVTVAGDVLIAPTGMAVSEGRLGDPRVHAIDRATGRLLWSVYLPALDPRLEEAAVRGPALVDEGVVVLGVRKFVRSRRTVSAYLVGLDLHTGALRWVRLMGSMGSLPFAGAGGATESGIIESGVVYRADGLGVVAAVEAHTGAPRWVRMLPGQSRMARGATRPWASAAPVIDGDTLVTLSPDRSELLRLDRATGAILARRPASALGAPEYLLRVGDQLVGVGEDRVQTVPIARFETEASRIGAVLGGPIVGRVTDAGGTLAVPVREGLAMIDPLEPAQPRLVRLEGSGNPVTLGSQVIIAGEESLASFLVWEEASRALLARLELDPGDPEPAITLADLAYRAGREEQIVPAADRALAAMERDPLARATAQSRQRLYDALHEMVEASLLARDGRDDGRPVVFSTTILSDTITRLGMAAGDAGQRVTHLVARGWLAELENDPPAAARAYQAVLDEPALAAATWDGPELQVRAELEATRRLRRLVLEHGRSVYEPFDRDALAALEGARAGVGDAAAAAARYPISVHAPALWLEAARAHERAGRGEAEAQALREGLRAAAFDERLEARAPAEIVAELGGRLVWRLAQDGRTSAAAELLADLRTSHPGLALTREGSPIDPAQLLDARSATALRVAPRFGPALAAAGVLEGWTLSEPVIPGEVLTDRVLLMAPDGGSVALFEAGGGELSQRWTLETGAGPTAIVRIARDHAILAVREAGPPGLMRVELGSGVVTWRTGPVRGLLDDRVGGGERLNQGGLPAIAETPMEGAVDLGQLLLAGDESTLLVVERTGRAAAFDAERGTLLWARQLEPRIIYDADAAGDLALIAGVTVDEAAGTEGPMIQAIELRSGALRYGSGEMNERPRWVRLTADGTDAIAGLTTRVVSIDLGEGRTNWEIADNAAALSAGAWIFGERLALLGSQRELTLVSLETGLADPGVADTGGIMRARGPIELHARGDRLVASTSAGVLVLDGSGARVGADALRAERLLPASVGVEHIAVLDAGAITPPEEGPGLFGLHVLTVESARLVGSAQIELPDWPLEMRALDGLILVATAGQTAVIAAPPAALPEP